MSRNTIVLDTETGGLDPTANAVCSIAMKAYGSSNPVKVWLIQPYKVSLPDDGRTLDNCSPEEYYAEEYTYKALSVNGHTLEELSTEGEPLDKVCSDIRKTFIAQNKKPRLLAHNGAFDVRFMTSIIPEFSDMIYYHSCDTMHVANYLRDRGVYDGNVKLTTLYKNFFGEDELFMNAHSADADVLMTERLYQHFLEMDI